LSVFLPGLRCDKADSVDVIKGDATNNKAALEALVHKHGGDFTQAQLSDNTAKVIAPDEKGMAV
jgi:DNA ligase-4